MSRRASQSSGPVVASQATFDASLRTDFVSFLAKAYFELEGSGFRSNWHLHAINFALERVRVEGAQRQIVTVPPRSLKSITITISWVAWMLGRDPGLKFCTISYSAELALQHARACRKLMQSEWYRRVFPRTRLDRTAEQDLKTTAGGGRYSTSVGGTMTGIGGDIIIIDDPINAEDGSRESARKANIEWFTSTLSSRLNDKTKGSIILVMQRVHEDDLAGFLLATGDWTHLNLPAIAVDDEDIPIDGGRFHRRRVDDVLHPEREPREVLEQQRRIMGSAIFSAQYQQAPVPAEGNMVQRGWFRVYDELPQLGRGRGRIVQSWDCASKTGVLNDWSVCITAGLHGRDVYVLDVYRQRLLFPELHKQAIALAARFRATTILVEEAASGLALIQDLHARRPAGMVRPIPIKPLGDKASRFSGITGRIEAQEVLLPRDAPWKADFFHELLAFPNGRHDDQADALAQLLNWSRGSSPIYVSDEVLETSRRPWGARRPMPAFFAPRRWEDKWRAAPPG